MLAPRAPGAFVCLQCQTRLARPRLPALPRRISSAHFSTSPRRSNDADVWETLLPASKSGLKITKEVQPFDRLRKRKGKVIRETSTKLGGRKQLGNDADILVLKEVGEAPPEEPVVVEERIEVLDVPDILATLQDDGALTPKEIYKRIESLRPGDVDSNEPQYVQQKVFMKFVKVLMESFTQTQLAAFYTAAKNKKQERVDREVNNGEKIAAKHPIKRTKWKPGTTPITKRMSGLDGAHLKEKRGFVGKQLLVDRILRDAWNFVLLEEIEASGQLEIGLKPWQIMLLNAGEDTTILTKIGEARKAKIEIVKEEKIIRITANKTSAEYAVYDIENALENSVTSRLPLKPWAPLLKPGKYLVNDKLASVYSQEDIDMVASLTRTNIQVATQNMISIKGLDKSAVNEAQRTLTKLLPLRESTTHTIDAQKLATGDESTYLLPVFPETDSLDHTQRNLKLGRWTVPEVRISESQLGQSRGNREDSARALRTAPSVSREIVSGIVANVRNPVEWGPRDTEEVSNWLPEANYNLSAEFGQALFPLGPRKSDQATGNASLPSVFLPVVPGLSKLITSPTFSAALRTQRPSLVYEFIPAAEQRKAKPDQLFPTLHIQMRAGLRGGKATLHKFSLGFQQCIHNVVLPDKAVDVRFLRYGRLKLKNINEEKSVQEWADAVSANLESGDRLTAPPLRIEIPHWTIPDHAPDAKGTRAVVYLFSGITFRQAVTGRFLDTNISYSTAQSGKLGAREAALSAYYNTTEEDGDPALQDEKKMEAFVKKCFKMVDRITEASAQTAPVLKIMNPTTMGPRKEDSARKLRRMAERAAAEEGDGVVDASEATEAVAADEVGDDIDVSEAAEVNVSEAEPAEKESRDVKEQ